MRKIKFWLWGFLGILSFFWAIAATWPEIFSLLSIRSVMINFTGVLGVGAMSFAMILALRPVWLESWLGGLDKSYRLFAKTHTLLAVAYLAIVFHGVMLMEYSYWLQPVGVVSGLLMAAGTIAAALILMGRIGRNRKVAGTIEHIDLFPDLNIMETSIRLGDGWKGHQGGQFAFVTFDPKEGAHPFTIGSAWAPKNPCINFITKGLGDYTNLMVENLKVGDKVTVEGPYGRFIFSDGKKRQIWIGGGIGITPFIARMKQLAHEPKDQIIDLFHTIPFKDPKAHQKMSTDVKAANVQLHLLVDGRDDRLTGEKLRTEIPEWKEASFWFCGPAKFGESLKKDLIANGLKEQDFHQELFNMR